MSPPDPRPLVFFTISNFPDLIRLPNGHTSRTKGLLRACSALSSDVRIFWLRNRRATSSTAEEVEQLILQHWGVPCKVQAWDLLWPAGNSFWHHFVWPLMAGIRHHPEFPSLSARDLEEIRTALAALDQPMVLTQLYQSFLIFEKLLWQGPVVCDYNDIEHKIYERKVQSMDGWGPRWLKRLQIPMRTRLDKALMERADLSLVCSSADKAYLTSRFGPLRIAVVPNAMPDMAGEAISPEGRDGMLFVGDLRYPPNFDALMHFAEDIHPRLQALGCSEPLRVVGPGQELVPGWVRSLPGIEIRGFADSLKAYYQDSKVVICPIRVGGGTRVKLIEAASFGKAIVSTRIGAEGLDFVDDESIAFADDPDRFAQALVRCLGDTGLRQRLGTHARSLFTQRYDEPAQRKAFLEAVGALRDLPATTKPPMPARLLPTRQLP